MRAESKGVYLSWSILVDISCLDVSVCFECRRSMLYCMWWQESLSKSVISVVRSVLQACRSACLLAGIRPAIQAGETIRMAGLAD